MRYLLNLILAFLCFFQLDASAACVRNAYVGSRENDPESIVENVSVIHGDYSDYEIDLVIPGGS